ncbi:MAG TPA: endonuclease MutS2 [Prevotella sp.]|nr:endonuclease MutS2 [Prevotella sp.]
MIYPKNFETKIGFNEIKDKVASFCLSTLGKGVVEEMTFSNDAETINTWMEEIREMRQIEEQDDFPLAFFFDVRDSLKRLRLQNTWIEESALFDIRRSLKTIDDIVAYLYRGEEMPGQDDDDSDVTLKKWDYPALHDIADGIATFPVIIQQIDQIIDKFGHIRDNASPELLNIRRELAKTNGSVSRILNSILRTAQSDGIVDKDAAPTMRDGRLVIPVAPGLKKKISGIVHDESATGRTVFVEPTEAVEANNKIRELEIEERKEIIRILSKMAQRIRPHVREMLDSYDFLAKIDFIQAKAKLAKDMDAFEPAVKESPYIDFIRARHPLLEAHLNGEIVPLDIMLTPEKHILIISGPNAGGKSVCLKTTGLLQYMLQCGLSVPVDGRSKCGVFDDIMIDIGDEQSLENDLSTYSSHLLNMKNMMRQASSKTLILIDEFGTGTEPQIGGAIAESVLSQFCDRQAWAVITTHYQNLKHFADAHDGVVNGAMLYDRHEMRPLFQLAIGRPGSSFAIEIARKIGLPEQVIRQASEIVGSDYIQSDKYLQDIVRDKRYWEQKRQTVHQKEKELQQRIEQYEKDIADVSSERKAVIAKAKQEAEELLKESNKRIENAIREIREQQAAKEETRKIRAELDSFKEDVADDNWENSSKKKKSAGLISDEDFQKKVEQLKARKQRREDRKKTKGKDEEKAANALRNAAVKSKVVTDRPIAVGDNVRLKGLRSQGVVEQLSGKTATVLVGDLRTKLPVSRIELATQDVSTTNSTDTPKSKMDTIKEGLQAFNVSHVTQNTIDEHRKDFHPDLDVRGMRGDEALQAVRYFIDDAVLMGVQRVRILHGKGNGILRSLIRQYLSAEPTVTNYHDEDVRFGGAGITVVDF